MTDQATTPDSTGAGEDEVHPAATSSQLRAIVERVERREEERREIAEQIKEVYAEAKANGFDAPTVRRVIALRRVSSAARAEAEALLDLYLANRGMLAQTNERAGA